MITEVGDIKDFMDRNKKQKFWTMRQKRLCCKKHNVKVYKF